jgi:hypothetical protein
MYNIDATTHMCNVYRFGKLFGTLFQWIFTILKSCHIASVVIVAASLKFKYSQEKYRKVLDSLVSCRTSIGFFLFFWMVGLGRWAKI